MKGIKKESYVLIEEYNTDGHKSIRCYGHANVWEFF